MKNYIIPTTVVDDFFDNPQWVREFALQQQFNPDPRGMWPGLRSAQLDLLHKPLFDHTVGRILSIFYDLHNADLTWHASGGFQLTSGSYNQGWVHKDMEMITAIIYLNDNAHNTPNGTTIYDIKEPGIQFLNTDKKKESFLNTDLVLENDKYRKEHNDNYQASTIVKNKFNRMVAFDSHLFHAADDFAMPDNTDRLTLVIFIDTIVTKILPLQRLKQL